MTSSDAPALTPPAVLGSATVFCRPLRYLFDVESSIAILRNDSWVATCSSEAKDVLGFVHVHVGMSTTRDRDHAHNSNELLRGDDDSCNQSTDELLAALIGRFVWVRVRLQLSPQETIAPVITSGRMRVQYQLSPATESFLLPVDHTNHFRVLVTEELLTQLSTKALQFNFLIPQDAHDDTNPKTIAKPDTVTAAAASVVGMSPEDAEAGRRATAAATIAAETAAEAAREAAAAAKAAMEAAQSSQSREVERDRAESKSREENGDRRRVLETEAMEKHSAMAKQQYEYDLRALAEEKERLVDAAERLHSELLEKQRTIDKWSQQTATTDQAIELLKQRLAGDAKEREELQRRLRVLEEEKLELLKKSRACVVQ